MVGEIKNLSYVEPPENISGGSANKGKGTIV